MLPVHSLCVHRLGALWRGCWTEAFGSGGSEEPDDAGAGESGAGGSEEPGQEPHYGLRDTVSFKNMGFLHRQYTQIKLIAVMQFVIFFTKEQRAMQTSKDLHFISR